jgi:hypothetical protein
MKAIYTIGTNGSTPTVLLSALLKHKIGHVYDIRRYPNTVFAKCRGTILNNTLSKTGAIGYSLHPELAPSRKLLKEEKVHGSTPDKYLADIGENALENAKRLIDDVTSPCFLSAKNISEINICYRKALIDKVIDSNSSESFKVEHVDGRKFFAESIKDMSLHEGKQYNILDVFHKVNKVYYESRYYAEDIIFAWEEMPGCKVLGYFRYPDLICLNPVLDQNNIPEPVVEAVVYHEMIHLQRAHDGLPFGHSTEFYFEEALFKQYAEMFNFDFTDVWESFNKGEKQ